MSPPRIWKTGERCRVTVAGRSVLAEVALASRNGVSLAVTFEALRTPAGLFLHGAALAWDAELGVFLDVRGSGVRFTLAEVGEVAP